MALLVCADCSTAFAVGLSACPQCRSTDHYEDGTMPKITRHGGPTNAADAEATGYRIVGEDGPELIHLPDGAAVIPRTPEEESSPGTSSSTSSTKPATTSEPTASDASKPARTTANRTAKARTASSTAPSTDTAPTAPTSAPDSGSQL